MSVETLTKLPDFSSESHTSDSGHETLGLPQEASAQAVGQLALAEQDFIPGVDYKLVMKETDPAIIQSQIEEGISREGLFGFLNNFEHHLPGGWHQSNLERYPELRDKGMFYDDLADEDDFFKPEPRPNAADHILHSERFLNATNASREEDTKRVVETTEGFDPNKLNELRQAYKAKREASPSRNAPEERTAYLEYALPIYKGLRELGYSHYDLWC